MDHDQLALCMREASRLLVANCAPAVVYEEEVIVMSCSNPDCRKMGCSTEPRPQGGPSPKR